jgi:hypothetical protein
VANILSGIRGGLEAFSRGYNNPLYKEEEEKRRRDEADTRTLGNILSQQSIPAYARKGGVYEETPEQILQTQRLQLGQLGTPEAIKVLGNLSPLTQERRWERCRRCCLVNTAYHLSK